MYNIFEAPFIKEIIELTKNLWENDWAENHAGNISLLIDESELKMYLESKDYKYEEEIGFSVPNLIGKTFLVTGAGKSFKNIGKDPADTLAIIKINDSGNKYQVLWGLESGGKPTSEFASHLMCHEARIQVDTTHRIVLHTHSTAIVAMTFIHELNEKKFTKTLWKMMTECILTFPDGVSVLPWIVAGTNQLGEASARKMKDSRMVIWPHHGIMSAGNSADDAYGLIETAEKAAQIYLMVQQSKDEIKQEITDPQLWALVDRFKLAPREGFLDPR